MTLTSVDQPRTLVFVILGQIICAAYFVGDVVVDFATEGWLFTEDVEIIPETLITLTLVLAIFFQCRYLSTLIRRKSALERQVSIAAGALHGVVLEFFETWRLTPAERDVALFTLKGLTIPEIAAHRGSAEGTVKSQLNAIYRKAGVTGRGALLSLLIEDLMQAPLLPGAAFTDPGQSPRAADRPHRTDPHPAK